jgi:predicted molibdopterin-dependent oxidoreductase YjgC
MTKQVRVVVDGRAFRVSAGSTLLQVTRRASRKVPVFCTGKVPCAKECCGLCVVEVEGELELKRACSHIVERPMSCETYTRRTRRERRRILSALLARHHHECPECSRRRTCDLLSLARDYEVTRDVARTEGPAARGTK